ncbi:murein hydrolase activator EnvC family protein [Aminipila terrae]|uniref:Peptidoglycan DD-metalloendopeptidase family protein n=1 Tax=Aminipila terrae TaxID=2697030 RepID=A0A6P1MGW7_9FIRM|nr:peptidoglycan DD-metalloendopeptidase family protein [Aminipila terrae]QHI71258.1 peptidoglycan DD-metalloendopeptidase family protein [Aminipila terrae]
MRKVISYTLVFVLVFSFGTLGLTYAGSSAQNKLDDVNDQLSSVKSQLHEGKKLENSLNKEIQNLEGKINASQAEIDSLNGNIAATQNKITEALAQLDQLEKNMDVQNNNLNGRLRTMYKNGSAGFIDVLLGSTSVTDLMTNLDRVQRIYDSDKQLMEQLQEEHNLIDAQKKNLLNLQSQLVASKEEAAQKKEDLTENQSAVADKKAQVASNNDALEDMEQSFLAEANRLKAEILASQSTGTTYKGGTMQWPAPGVTKITSPFGYRIHPILKVKKLHTGVDIGAPSGTTIVAANAGTVIKAGWNNSYGNMIMIDHGGGIVTLYAHNSSLLVKAGDVVSRGQAISKSGSTGQSTGPHLHFEVRVNGNYVDPQSGWI